MDLKKAFSDIQKLAMKLVNSQGKPTKSGSVQDLLIKIRDAKQAADQQKIVVPALDSLYDKYKEQINALN